MVPVSMTLSDDGTDFKAVVFFKWNMSKNSSR